MVWSTWTAHGGLTKWLWRIEDRNRESRCNVRLRKTKADRHGPLGGGDEHDMRVGLGPVSWQFQPCSRTLVREDGLQAGRCGSRSWELEAVDGGQGVPVR